MSTTTYLPAARPHRSSPVLPVGLLLALGLLVLALAAWPTSVRGGVGTSAMPPAGAPDVGSPAAADAPEAVGRTMYFPIVRRAPRPTPPPAACATVPGASYGDLDVNGSATDRPAAEHADLNLGLRSYRPTNAYLGLVDYGGDTDSRAPQFPGLFADHRTPGLAHVYQVYNWEWGSNTRGGPITGPEVTLAGLTTTPGETIHLPDSGYDIGSGYEALVLYASSTENRLTLKYTREDNVVRGYTLHLENVCVEPSLLALYQLWDSRGRGRLPALKAGQAVGRAARGELGVAIRDNGTFLDPRSRKDWWRGR